MLRSSTLAICTAAALASAQAAHANPLVLAEFPTGTFLENLALASDGATVYTSYFDRQIGVLSQSGQISTLSELQLHPVGILGVDGGFVVTAHGVPFTQGPEFTQTQQILFLDESGVVQNALAVKDALFLNGLTQLSTGQILIADSIAGTIWALDLQTQSVTPWLSHELFTQNPDLPMFAPGANGVKQDGDRVLVSNSGRGALYEIALNADGTPASGPALAVKTGPIDDFHIDDGRIVFATHGAALMQVERDGTLTTLLADGCDGCTSVLRADDAYIVLTTGGLLEGHANPARILSVPAE